MAAAQLRQCCPFPRFSSLFNTTLHPHRFFSSRQPSPARGLRPLAPQPSLDSDNSPATKRSRNELKREARQAVRWGMALANFTPPQIKRVLRIAALDLEVFEALMLVKKMGPDVREGRRRQFNYIGKLLRTVQPELMDALIQASKDGDESRLLALSADINMSTEIVEAGNDNEASDDNANDFYEDEYEHDEDPYDESENYTEIAARWFDGLVDKDPSVTNEVYSINIVEFDRQELRKLVRKVHSVQEIQLADKSGVANAATLINAKKPLISFLRELAKKVAREGE